MVRLMWFWVDCIAGLVSGYGIPLDLVLKETAKGPLILAEQLLHSCHSNIAVDEMVALSDMI